MNSVWKEKSHLPIYNSLEHDIKTEVLIIGGGLAGILCNYMLTQAGIDCVLVEADRICSGITKNTTAKITSQHGFIFDKLISEFDVETATLYLKTNEEALGKYRTLCKTVDCDFEEKDNYVYSIDDTQKVQQELTALHKIGFPAQVINSIPLPFSIAGAVKFPHQAQFNPLKFISGIVDGLSIYEKTAVRELIGTTAITDHGKIKANKIIVTTHFPFLNKHGSYFLKLYQHRSYVIALENAPYVNGMYVDEAQKGLSFRNYDNLLLIGGGDHRTGKQGGNFAELEDFAKRYYPNCNIKYRWATQDCMTLDSVPYIGAYSASTSNLYVATGFNKWGMTSSMVSALLLCDLVQGKENPYACVFSPSRTILRPQLAANAFEAVMNLLTPTVPRCPHMGCALKWNKLEHSWDCSCHGSRFAKDGKIIDNPATGDLKLKGKK
ncbi:FAD-dependent oxidoreductase [Sporanaerobium hydrogeniformans]|uniref:FAD-dependent oxidoreductase n=1 Tax=Sporanaerobium hydrogeniformans TaxID=3072179 RepID=A0AC61DCU0_9FIRM|nr:FAD-dependent oxidoreductase [Sporanaerobium hydrogeniformans]PHV70782.1 FAD-dependent oxidoreductase [Sporanaerobium hydrogeniformans]